MNEEPELRKEYIQKIQRIEKEDKKPIHIKDIDELLVKPKLKFMLRDTPNRQKVDDNELVGWEVIQILPEVRLIGTFWGNDEAKDYLDIEVARAMAGDYVEFLNDKYFDKEINKEWPKPNNEERAKYHLEEAKKYIERMNE